MTLRIVRFTDYGRCMWRASKSLVRFAAPLLLLMAVVLLFDLRAHASVKIHTVAFGKWMTVQLSSEADSATKLSAEKEAGVNEKLVSLKVRSLVVDGRTKEFTVGTPHDVTDRIFVVRRAFRINDSLPSEAAPHWDWQRGGWISVDRSTGHVSVLNLPDFDPSYSEVSWYRDYAAYWGVSDDGKEVYSMVAQIGRRKPIVKALLPGINFVNDAHVQDKTSTCACTSPEWQRSPTRVIFEAMPAQKRTYVIFRHAGDLLPSEEDEEEASK